MSGTHNFKPLEHPNWKDRCFISSVILALGQSDVIFEMCVVGLWISEALEQRGEETVRESRALKESALDHDREKNDSLCFQLNLSWRGDGHSALASQRLLVTPAGQGSNLSVILGATRQKDPQRDCTARHLSRPVSSTLPLRSVESLQLAGS